jgi:hypothetical protein
MKTKLPQSIKVCLWSYDTDKISLSNPHDRYRIIINVLNRGTEEAVVWLLGNFSKKEIAETIKESYGSEWDSKSVSFWTTYFHASPKYKSRLDMLNEIK